MVTDENGATDADAKDGEFSIEYSKSNRSKCKKCEKRIDKVLPYNCRVLK